MLISSYPNRQECLFYHSVGQTFLSDHKVLGQLINPHSLMIFVGAGLVPAHNGGKHKALPLQNVNDFLIGINSNVFAKSTHKRKSGLRRPQTAFHRKTDLSLFNL